MIELGLGLVAKKTGELGERDRLFGCVNNGFDLCFKAHGLVGVLLSIPMLGMIAFNRQRRSSNADSQEVDKTGGRSNRRRCHPRISAATSPRESARERRTDDHWRGVAEGPRWRPRPSDRMRRERKAVPRG